MKLPMVFFPGGVNAYMAGMTSEVFGQSYQDARAKGLSLPQSVSYGASQAAIEYATEKIPVSRLIGDLKAGSPLYKTVMAQLAAEIPGEQVATLLQDLNEWAVLHPEKPFSDYVKERPDAAVQTLVATIVGTSGNIAVTKTLDAAIGLVVDHEIKTERAKQAAQLKTMIDQMGAAADESKTRARDELVFNQFVADTVAGTAAENLYISAEALYQSGMAEEAAKTLPSVASQLGTAQVDNGYIQIPTAEFLTNTAGTELRQALIDNVKIDPNGFTFAESQQYQDTFDQEMQIRLEKMIVDKAGDEGFKASRDIVRDNLLADLNASGRFTADVNTKYAELVASFYAAAAAKAGITPEQMAELYGLRTQAAAVTGGRQLDQAITNNPDNLTAQQVLTEAGRITASMLPNSVVDLGTADGTWAGSDTLNIDDSGNVVLQRRADNVDHLGKGWNAVDLQELQDTSEHSGGGRGLPTSGRSNWLDSFGVNRPDSVVGTFRIPVKDFLQLLKDGNAIIGNLGEGEIVLNPAIAEQYLSDIDGKPVGGNTLNQSATLRSGDETLEKYGLDAEGRYTTREVAAALEARQREQYGLIDPEDRTDQAIERIANWMAEEVRFEMRNPEKSGVGWYSEKFQRALDNMAEAFPELKDSKDARNLMTALIAITSDGQKVVPNFAMAIDIYGRFREGGATQGQFTTSKGHARQSSINKNLAVIQRLYDMMGPTSMHEYLMQEKTIKELKVIAKENGGELKSDYQVHIRLPMAAVEFGPKLGAFYANLMGAHGYLTMDRWWSRTFNRYRGTLLQTPTAESLRNFAELIGKKKMSDDQVLSAVVDPRNALERRGFKTLAAVLMGESEPGGKADKAAWFARLDKLREEGALKAALATLKAEKQRVIDNAEKLKDSTRASAKTKAKAREDAKKAKVIVEDINALPRNFTVDKLLQQHNVERMANTIYKTAFQNLEDAPFNATDRTFMLDAVNKAQQQLAGEGYNLSVADIQAILWYYEKRLYGDLGARQTADISYEEAAKQVVDAYADGEQGGRFDDILDDARTASEDGGESEGEVSPGDELYQSSGALEQPARGSIKFNEDITRVPSIISLLQNADFSTFIHESGHFFLQVSADLASRIESRINAGEEVSEGEQSIVDDMNTTLKWFGLAGSPEMTAIQQWMSLSLEEQRPYHEKWAEGFERYAFEGKAPSTELQGIFRTFAGWLKQIYKKLSALDVQLTDEVRGVMDRMLASADAINQAEQVREMGAMFTPENSEGLLEDWKAYHDLALATTQQGIDELQARALTDMKWLANARSKRLKEMQRENKDRRMVVAMDVRRSVMSQQVYQAWQFLTGRITEDDKIKDQQPPKSNRDVVDPRLDSLFVAIAKMGGIDREQAKAQWGLEEKIPFPIFGKPVVRAENGRTLDEITQMLAEEGYISVDQNGKADINELEEKFFDELRGATQYSNQVDPTIFEEIIPGTNVNTDAINAGRLDLTMLNSMGLAPEIVERLKDLKMTATKDAFAPDIIAEKFGYESGEQMVRDIAAAPAPAQVIEQKTDQMMLQLYGDLATPEGMEQAVNESLFNDMRLRLLHAEGKALDKAMNVRGDLGQNAAGQKKTFAVLPAAARQFAQNIVDRLQLKNLRPTQYTAAAEQAGKNAERAFNKGDTEAAARFKRNQILNSHTAQAALQAADEIDKGKRFFARVLTGTDKKVARERDMDIVNAARAVLAQFGYEGKAKTAVEYLESVKQYDPALHEILIASVNAAQAIAKPLNQLTVAEFRAVRDEIEALWHLSKRNRQIEIDGNLMDRQDAAQALNLRMAEIGIPDKMPGESHAVTPEEEAAMKLQQAKAVGRRVESWVDLKDGSEKMGAFRRFIWNPIKDAADRYRSDKVTYLKQFRGLLDEVMSSMKREVIDAPELGYTFGKDSGGVAMNEILHALLHTGNDSNKRKLLLGRGWADLNEDGTVDTSRWDAFINRMIAQGKLTKAHYDFAQGVWDMLESMKPGAQKAHRDAYGRYFAEVTANPVVTPFGVYSGGYVPAKVDARIVKDAELRKMIEEGKEGMAYAFPTTPSGFTKSRTEYNKPLMLDLRTLAQHIDQVLLFTHLENPVRNVKLLLSDKDVSANLNKIDPAALNTMLTPWLTRAARQQVTVPVAGIGWVNRVASTLRQRTSMATMFANVMNALQQVTGFSLAALKVKPTSLLSATAEYVFSPKQTAASVAALSPYMADRMENEAHAMMGQIEEILINPNLYKRTQEWTKKHQYFLQSAVDNVMGPIIWTGAYNDAIAEGYEQKDAIRLADAAIRQTQGSNLAEDVSRIETGPAYNTLVMQFASYFNMQANLLGTEFGKVAQEMGLRKGMGKGFMIFMLGFYAPAIVAEIIAQAFRGGPPDDDKDGEFLDDWLMALFVTGPLRNATAMIPVLGQIGNAVVARFNNNPADDRMSLVPAVSQIESAINVPFDAYELAVGRGRADKTVKDVGSLISITTGLPASVAAKPVSYLVSTSEGRVNPTGPVDAARGLITGVASPQSK